MTSLERLAAELAGVVLLCGAFIGWWQLHNRTEQTIGAEKCIISTTEVKADAVADNSAAVAAQALQLTQVVKTYDDQVSALSRGNAALAQRLQHNALRASTSAGPGSAACEVRPVELPAAQSAPLQQLLDDCDADHAALIGVTAAYNDWRNRMIALQ